MCVNNLSKVALDSAAAGIEPAISSRKSNALTTTSPNLVHCFYCVALLSQTFVKTSEKIFCYMFAYISATRRYEQFTDINSHLRQHL